jgi:hypothetical protein
MKIVRHGVALLIIIYLSLSFMVGFARFHQVVFKNEACIIPLKDYNYRTCQDIRVTIDGKKYIISKDFQTDLASIPRLLWPILAPQYAGFVPPAILHDYLYRCHTDISRRVADEILYSALISEHVTAFTASKFFIAVRLFGRSHFGEYGGVCYSYENS